MIEAETALLTAVVNHLRDQLDLRENQCDAELDDEVPAVAGERYFAVVPAGGRPGPRHNTSGGVFDMVFGCRVTVFQRMAEVPRDRRRSVFMQRTIGINAELTNVMNAIDFNYPVLTAANLLVDSVGTGEGFLEPLKFAVLDERPQPVMRDPYDAAVGSARGGHPILAIKRGIVFHGARFLKKR